MKGMESPATPSMGPGLFFFFFVARQMFNLFLRKWRRGTTERHTGEASPRDINHFTKHSIAPLARIKTFTFHVDWTLLFGSFVSLFQTHFQFFMSEIVWVYIGMSIALTVYLFVTIYEHIYLDLLNSYVECRKFLFFRFTRQIFLLG